MYFEELIKHLYQIKLFAYLEKNNLSILEYLKSITDLEMLKTELSIKSFNYDIKTVERICSQSAKASLYTYQDEETDNIKRLLKKSGFEKPLFGNVVSDLKEVFELLKKNEFNELRLYVLGKSKEELKLYFGEFVFNQNYKNLKSDEQIFNCYIEVINNLICPEFVANLKLLQTVKTSLNDSITKTKEEFNKYLKTKEKDDKNNFIVETYNSYVSKFDSTHYIVVSKVVKFDYLELSELSNFLFSFFKTNSINPDNFENEKQEIIRSISYLIFTSIIENEYPFVKTKELNTDIIFALIQNRNQLYDILNPDYIDSFSKIEKQLIDEKYFDSAGVWIKEKNLLAEFIIHCSHCGYFKYRRGNENEENKKYLAVRRFFEARYDCKIEN